MAENIGDAQIAIEVALEKLYAQLAQVQNSVEKTIEQTKKEIEISIKTNVNDQLDKLRDSVQRTQDKTKEFSEEWTSVFNGVHSTVRQSIGGVEGVLASMVTRLAVVGGAVTAVTGVIGIFAAAVYLSREEISKKIDADKELSDALATVSEAGREFKNILNNVYQELKDNLASSIVNAIKNLVDMWNEMNKTTGAGDNLLNSLKNLIQSGMEALGKILISTINLLFAFAGVNSTSSNNVDELGDSVQGTASAVNTLAVGIDTISSALSGMIDWVSKAIGWLKDLSAEIQKISDAQLNIVSFGTFGLFKQGLLGIGNTPGGGVNLDPNALSPNNPDAGNFKNYGSESSPGTQDGKNKFNLEGNKTTSSRGKEKEIDLEKEEKKILDEINSAYEYKINLTNELIKGGKATKEDLLEILNAYRSSVDTNINLLNYQSNINDATLLQEKLSNQIKDIKDQQLKSEQEAYKLIVDKAGKESESLKDYLRMNQEAEIKLKGLKIQNSGDEKAIELFNIDEKYRKEINNINSLKISEELKIKTTKELEIKKASEIEAINNNATLRNLSFMQSGFDAVTGAISSGFTRVWNSVFGEAHSLFQILIKGIYDSLIQLAASAIFKSVINLLSGGAAGGVFGFIGKLFSGAGGGYTGDGQDNEFAGIVHRNEYVVSSAGTSIAGNRELLEAMNRGEDVASLIGSYERRNINSESLRSDALSRISSSGFGSGERNININIDGVTVNAKIQKLTGLNENDWIGIVDEELLPQISKGLKRAGKPVLDNSLN